MDLPAAGDMRSSRAMPAASRIKIVRSMRTPAERPDAPGDELRRSEERFRLLIERVQDYAIFMLDREGLITSWNVGAERIKGYAAEEAIGRHFSVFYPPEDIAAGKPQENLRRAVEEGRVEDEGWRVRRDGSRFWADVVITALFDEEGRLHGFAKVTRDMTERRRAEALQEADRQKNQFLAVLAHELRNPLAPILNALHVIGRPDAGPEAIAQAQAIAERQVRHMAKLLDDLLDVSRVSEGRIELRREVLDLARTAKEAAETMRGLAAEREQQLRLELPDEAVPVDADPTRIDQVLINLLGNAIRYTPPGGRLSLSVARDEQSAVVRVRDNGFGIEPDMLPKIFDFFVQAGKNRGSAGGFGIGLTLVRKIVELHGGTVTASSAGPGQGSEFVVRLPLAERPRENASANAAAEEAVVGGEPLRVLVVDDNVDLADSLVLMLRFLGHEVRAACDGPEALAAAAEFSPDLVVLDVGMPGMNGYEVARRLRIQPGGGRPYVAALTGWGEPSDRVQSRASGINEHLVKPVEPKALERVLEAARLRLGDRNAGPS
jgi:PAS domain S-box-containing protein